MRSSRDDFIADPDYIAEGFLIRNFIHDPDEEKWPGNADYSLRYWREGFYRWEAGRFVPVSDCEMKLLIKRHVHNLNEGGRLTGGEDKQRIGITSQLISNIMLCLAGTEGVHLPETRELNTWPDGRERIGIRTLSFKNGLVMLGPKSDVPVTANHLPRYFSLSRLPYDYDENADCPRWMEFLGDVMDGDIERIELLQQWAGYVVFGDSSLQKFMLIAGEGGNGKTVFSTVIERMVGQENVTHVPLCSFGGQFALSATLGKMLNSTSESSARIDELAETMLKGLTSGDRMTFERKYRLPVHAVPTVKIMISTNQLPQFADRSSGIWRRMLFVPFEKCFATHRQNPHLVTELCRELPGVFNWAIKGWKKLRSQGRFIEPRKCTEAVEQYRCDVNPARTFLLDNYAFSFDFEGLPCKEVYDAYAEWCFDNGHRPLNSSNFGKEVKRVFPRAAKTYANERGIRKRIYDGIAVIESSEMITTKTKING